MANQYTKKTPAGVKTGGSFSHTKKSTISTEVTHLTETLTAFRKMGVFTKDELKSFMQRVANLQIKATAKLLGVEETLNRGVLPVLLAGRPLAHGDRHPDFTGWLTADEIGKPFGLSYEKVTKFTKQMLQNNGGSTRANAEIHEHVENFGFPQPDKYAYLAHISKDQSSVAIWAAGKDGTTAWRNYWSPEAVSRIQDEIRADGLTVLPATQQNGTRAEA